MFPYALVIAGKPEELRTIRHGSLVCARPSRQAFFRGSPAPEFMLNPSDSDDIATTLLGVALSPVTFAGQNSGMMLAVVSMVVSGPAPINFNALEFLDTEKPGWQMWQQRRLLVLPAEHQIVIK